jgi:hypothetical protein
MTAALQLISYALVAYGLYYIVGASKISLPFRTAIDPGMPLRNVVDACRSLFITLIECAPCSGFWIGVAGSLLVRIQPLEQLFQPTDAWRWLLYGIFTTATNNFLTARMPEE